jgi:Tol biopolymer transport system component/DNA-binding winged helix-turn-helix (wHTH) protein
MATARPCSRCARFDKFEVDLAAGELRKSGDRVALQDQPFQILRLLIEAAPEVVTREQISSVLWPSDTFVDFDLAINTAIKKLRQTLDDTVYDPKFIQTVAKRGYKFLAKVDWIDDVASPSFVSKHDGAKRWRRRSISAIASVVFTAIVTLLWWFWPQPEPILMAVPLTTFSGVAGWPSLSPDGQQIAFGWNSTAPSSRSGELFVQPVAGSGPPLQLTHSAGSAFLYSWLSAWTPDGKWITYLRYNSKPGLKPIELVLIPAPTGGPETILQRINGGDCGLSWSPDGKYLAFVDRELPQEPHAIYLLQRDTLERRRVTTPPKETLGGDAYPEFSHDGRRIAFVRNLNGGAQLAVLTLSSGSIRTLLSERSSISGLTWDPADRSIIYASNLAGALRLWRIAAAGGTPRPLGIGEDGWAPSVSERTHRLTYAQGTGDMNVWLIRSSRDNVETRTPLIASSRQDFQPELSPDETKIAFSSDRSGAVEIWVADADGSNSRQVTELGTSNTGRPHWSPDAAQITFDSGERGKPDIYVVGLNGAKPRRLTDDKFDDSWPSWSADGKWIFYQSNRSGEIQVWKVPAMGGQAIQVTTGGGLSPLISPDGKHLYYLNIITNNHELWEIDLPDGKEQRVADIPPIDDPGTYQVMNDGIYFTAPDSSVSDAHQLLRYFSLKTRRTRTLTSVGRVGWSQGISVSRDGRTILYAQQDHATSNLMLVENFH